MKQFANDSKWCSLYYSLDVQAKKNEEIIFSKIPDSVSDKEIEEVIQELNSLGNFKNYYVSRNKENIKGVRRV